MAVSLAYEEARLRLFRMSFDPYHCVERRWGAAGAEASSCRDGAAKRAWYEAEQRLRNQIDRTYDARMDFTVRDLEASAPGSGIDTAPDVDVKATIDGMGYRVPFKGMQPPGY